MFPLTCPNFCTPAEAITTSPIRLQRQEEDRLIAILLMLRTEEEEFIRRFVTEPGGLPMPMPIDIFRMSTARTPRSLQIPQ